MHAIIQSRGNSLKIRYYHSAEKLCVGADISDVLCWHCGPVRLSLSDSTSFLIVSSYDVFLMQTGTNAELAAGWRERLWGDQSLLRGMPCEHHCLYLVFVDFIGIWYVTHNVAVLISPDHRPSYIMMAILDTANAVRWSKWSNAGYSSRCRRLFHPKPHSECSELSALTRVNCRCHSRSLVTSAVPTPVNCSTVWQVPLK